MLRKCSSASWPGTSCGSNYREGGGEGEPALICLGLRLGLGFSLAVDTLRRLPPVLVCGAMRPESRAGLAGRVMTGPRQSRRGRGPFPYLTSTDCRTVSNCCNQVRFYTSEPSVHVVRFENTTYGVRIKSRTFIVLHGETLLLVSQVPRRNGASCPTSRFQAPSPQTTPTWPFSPPRLSSTNTPPGPDELSYQPFTKGPYNKAAFHRDFPNAKWADLRFPYRRTD